MQAITRWLRRQSTWLESQQTSILSAAFIIVIANVLSAVSGLIKNRVLASAYITPQYKDALDAYFVAFRLPDFLYQLVILGVLSAAFVPLFAQNLKTNKEHAFNLARQAMIVLLALMIGISLFVAVFTEPFVHIFTGESFSSTQVSQAIHMTRIMLISQIFFALSGFYSAMLQGAKRFVMPSIAPVFYNLGIILTTLVAKPWLGIDAAAWGTVVGALLHFLIQVPVMWKLGFHLFTWPRWVGHQLFELFTLTGPRTLTLVMNQMNLFVITYLATSIGELNLTKITFAQQLMTFPIRFFGVAIGQAALPFLAVAHDDREGFQKMVFRSLRQIAFFTAPAAVLLLVLRLPIVRLAYGTEGLPWLETLDIAFTLGILALSVAPQAITHLLIRAFYALNDTLTPFFVALFYFGLTTVLGWQFVFGFGWQLGGIAAALTIAATVEMVVLLVLLIWRIGAKGILADIWSLARITAAAFVMAVCLFVLQRWFDLYVFETSKVIQLLQLTFVVSTIGGLVYLGLCWAFRVRELLILRRLYDRLRHQWKKAIGSTPEFVDSPI